MIPKTIHYCWFGKGRMSGLQEACLSSWEQELPGYEIVRWDESNAPMEHPFIAHHYRRKNWAFISDFVRFYALKEHGGVYLDTDVEVVRSLTPLLEQRIFLGEEKAGRINTAVIGALSNEPFLDACMEYMLDRHRKNLPYHIAPEVATRVLQSGGYPEVKVYGSRYFYPYNPYDRRRAAQLLYHDVTEETYAIHHWAKSWRMGIMERVMRKLFR